VPILMLTSLQDVSYKVRGFELGADDFLNKPVDRVELVARVRSLLRLKQYHDELEQKNILLRQALSRYVVEEVANELLAHKQQNLYLNGQISQITVLYADLRGFRDYMQNHDAQVIVKFINLILGRLVPIIFEQRGTFDKYMSDAIMAFFGAPVQYQDDAFRAVRSAVEMREAFHTLQKESPEIRPFSLGIGIYTDEAVVGYIGSDQAMDYTVLGVPPNAAKGLGEYAKTDQVLIDSGTNALIGNRAVVNPVIPLHFKRKGEPTTIEAFEVLSLNKDAL